MELRTYLSRLGYKGPVRADLATLRAMHRAHYFHVPFENLDIQRKVPIVVDLARNYEKIVDRRRGGWCMELTGLFAWALREIGFRVDLLGARVLAPDGRLGPPHSHMAALVHLDEPWLADVGFGGRNVEPLRLADRGPQAFEGRSYVIAQDGDHYFVTQDDPWVAPGAARTYVFTLTPRELPEYLPACEWLQSSPESPFARGDVATLPLPRGRITYSAGRLLIASGDARDAIDVPEADRARVLAERFGILL